MAEKISSTHYDEAVCTKRLQMLKTIVPYVESNRKKQIVAMISFMEYQTALHALDTDNNELSACEIPDGSTKTTSLLTELKEFCNPNEKEAIDNMLNLLCIMENYELFSS